MAPRHPPPPATAPADPPLGGIAARRLRWSAYAPLVAALLPFLALAAPVRAQGSGDLSALAGTWRSAPAAAETQARVAAIERATAGVNLFFRGHVRGQLRERTAPVSEFRIAVAGSRVTLTGPERSVRFELGGPPVVVQGDDGEGRLRGRARGTRLQVRIQGERGTITSTYRASTDRRRLVVSTSLNGTRLEAPLRFQHTYRRR